MFSEQLAWYIAGPALGLCVIACRLLFNARLGVTGGFSEVIGQIGRGSLRFDWRGWFLIGVVLGGTLFMVLAGGRLFTGYSWLTDAFHGTGGDIATAGLLLVAGVLIGYGAKLSGGCTSGNGLSGVAALSPAALVATATFFGTAIAVSFLIKALI
jgi:uncharacterized protein